MQYHYISDKELYHFGRSKRDGAKVGSGRYPLGSGEAGLSRHQQKKNYKHIKKQLKKTGKLDSNIINELHNIFDKNVNDDDRKKYEQLASKVTTSNNKYEKLRSKIVSNPDFSDKIDRQMKKDGLDPDDRHRGYWEEEELENNKELTSLEKLFDKSFNELRALENEKYSKTVTDYIGKYANKNINYITKSAIYGDMPHFGTVDEVLRRYIKF